MKILAAALTIFALQHISASAEAPTPVPTIDTGHFSQAPSLGVGMDMNEQPTFFIYHEKTGYEPASMKSVRSLFDRLLSELSSEVCGARLRPDILSVTSGVVRLQWDVNSVCSGRANPTPTPASETTKKN